MSLNDKEKLKEYRKMYYLKNKEKYKCQHNRIKSQCRDCGGSKICEHNRLKSTCRDLWR